MHTIQHLNVTEYIYSLKIEIQNKRVQKFPIEWRPKKKQRVKKTTTTKSSTTNQPTNRPTN